MKSEDLDLSKALVYMGSRGRDASSLMPLVNECAEELVKEISPHYIYRLFRIDRSDKGIEVFGTELFLAGDSVKEHLEGCDSCILLCATLSSGADKLIRRFEAYDMARAFVTDCIASSAIETVCDEAEDEIRKSLPGKYFTWRFSPGYGDLSLDLQGMFLDVLNAPKRIGLNVTDSGMLVPSKSVTAVIGVSNHPLPEKRRGCVGCQMFDNCSFRKGGDHCGAE